jgi:hypothetical protein
MRLSRPFLKLPIRFDADALAAEVRALPTSAWTAHPTGFVGNEAVRLVTPDGEPTDDLQGRMAPTPQLRACPYIQEIMAEIGGVWGRSRLMGLAAGCEVPSHIDINYYWRTHLRIHIPVITNPGVEFTCDDETVHMAAGECWIFDSFRWHDVQNKGDAQRIHLVLDTVGGGLLPQLMKAAEQGREEGRLVRPGERRAEGLLFENVNAPLVMTPWEMRCHLAFVADQAGSDPRIAAALDRVDQFIDAWAAAWAHYGADEAGRPAYARLLGAVRSDLGALGVQQLLLPNGLLLPQLLEELIFHMALAQPSARSAASANAGALQPVGDTFRERLDRPIFIVSTPRSGSTLLYETLEQAPGLYSTGDESHWLIEDIPGLSPPERSWSSNRLIRADATPERAERLAQAFYSALRDREIRPPSGRVRMLEKTPKNALRVPFFEALWPDASFIYLYRDVRETLYSMLEAWQSGGFRTYPELPGWQGPPWSLLLVPGWQRLSGLPLHQIVAHQWAITTEQLIGDLEQLDESRVLAIDYGELLASPQAQVEKLAQAVGLDWDRKLAARLPLSKTTLSEPKPHKWRRIEPLISSVWPIVENADGRARAFLDRHRV